MTSHAPDDIRLSYAERGAGTPLVLLHGFPLDSRMWDELLPMLSATFRVIIPDLRGFGVSRSEAEFTIASLADDLHRLLTAIGATPCILGGMSMGGYVALAYLRQYPSAVRGLILMDTKAEGDTPEGKAARDKSIELVRSAGSTAIADQMLPRLLSPDSAPCAAAVVESLRNMIESCPVSTIERALRAMRDRPDQSALLASITVPTLIVVGEADAITPPTIARSMQEQIRGSSLAIIKNSGHMSPMEQPEQVAQAVVSAKW